MVGVSIIPELEGREREISAAHWSVRLTGSRFNEKPYLKIRQRVTEEVTRCSPLQVFVGKFNYHQTHTHTLIHTHTYTGLCIDKIQWNPKFHFNISF